MALSTTAAVSVISSVSLSAGNSFRRRAVSTRPGRSASERLQVARLTLMPSG